MNFERLPKIELHCHLDGSVRAETILDIAIKENIKIPTYKLDEIKNMMIAPIECSSLEEYLQRFYLPIAMMQSKESLKRIAFELFEDGAKENIKYMEVRFAPLLHIKNGLSVEEIIESVLMGIKAAEESYGIKGNLILSFLRNMAPESIFEVIEVGKKYLGKGVVAVDLCGAEHEGFSENFIEPIARAKSYGYKVTIHAGETGIGRNVLEAVELLGAERIGHGVFINNCNEAYDIVKKNHITLEMCPTSNIQTKAVNTFEEHPIYAYYKDGIKITINTDNRTVSNVNLTNEYSIIGKSFNMECEDYKRIYDYSVNASFADEKTKEYLRSCS
jgi:adenosine deaminase